MQQKLTIFKLDSTTSNNLQHVATHCYRVAKHVQYVATLWPNVCNTLRVTQLQDVPLKCCVRLAGPLYLSRTND